MRRRARYASIALLVLAAGTAACSAILGLDPPPQPDAAAGAPDASEGFDVPVPPESGPLDAGSPVCAPLDSGDGSLSYFPLSPIDTSDAGNWDFFDQVDPGHGVSFAGGTFDGRYVYFAGRGAYVARYDTQADSFEDPTAWTFFTITGLTPAVPGAFTGAVYDGRFVYFVPSAAGAKYETVVARYDTLGSFTVVSSWSSFDMSTLQADAAGPILGGFAGGTFDGRYVYFVPKNDGVPDGHIVRFDTTLPDGGDPPDAAGDAGDAGDAGEDSGVDASSDAAADAAHDAGASDSGVDSGDAAIDAGEPDSGSDAGDAAVVTAFGNPMLWQTFDITSLGGSLGVGATGYYGALFDGTYVYLVPQDNALYGNLLHGGGSSIAARFHTDASFNASSSWTLFDLSTVNGLAANFAGAAFDGRFVYLAPHGSNVAVQLDTQGSGFNTMGAWATYDLNRLGIADAEPNAFIGAAFDGRFVYYVPSGVNFATVARYDTLGTFGADCAWSTVDISGVDAGDAAVGNFIGAVFDGQYVYFIPNSAAPFARFKATSLRSFPAALPATTHGSFL